MSAWSTPYCGAPLAVFSTLTTITGLSGWPSGIGWPVRGEISTSFSLSPFLADGSDGEPSSVQAARRSAAATAGTRSRNFMPPSMPQSRREFREPPPSRPGAWRFVLSAPVVRGLRRWDMSDALDRFAPATREWFSQAFAAPTPAQVGAWEGFDQGDHVLVVAPTGSGKTLAAFLSSIDRLLHEAPPKPDGRTAGHPRALRVAAQGARGRRRAQPPLPARRHHAGRRPGVASRSTRSRSGSGRATPRSRNAAGWSRIRPTSSSPRPSRCS